MDFIVTWKPTYRGRGDVEGFYAKWAGDYDGILIKNNLCEINNYAASKLAKVENPVMLDVACGNWPYRTGIKRCRIPYV